MKNQVNELDPYVLAYLNILYRLSNMSHKIYKRQLLFEEIKNEAEKQR